MIHVALALLVLVPVQDPDRSTPEKACENFTKWWFGLRADSARVMDIMMAGEKLGLDQCTDAWKGKVEARLKKSAESREDFKTLSWSTKMLDSKKNDDGTVTINVKLTEKKRTKDFDTGERKEETRERTHQFVFEKSGDLWMMKEAWQPCFSCEGSGKCGSCKGEGKMADQKCYGCDGAKSCNSCKGEKMRKEKLGDIGADFAIPDKDPAFSSDLSSAEGAAAAYADLQQRRAYEQSRNFLAFITDILKEAKLYFAPSIMKTIDDGLKEAKAKGNETFEKSKVKIDALKVEGDTATAMVLPTTEGKERPSRIVLKKTGDKWLLDSVQSKCWSCDGKGDCTGCKGTGKFMDEDCYSCKGKKKCKGCEGAGWKEQDY